MSLAVTGFLKALRSELLVARHTLGAKLVVILPSLFILLQYLVVKLGETGSAARDSLLGQGSFDELISNNAWGHFVDGLNTGLTLLGLLLVAQAAYSFSMDRDSGALRHLLIRSSGRRAVVFAKLVHLHLLALLAILLLITTSYLASAALWEFGPVVEDGFELISEEEIGIEIRLGLQLALIPLPAAIAFGLLVSVLAHSSTQAVVSALGLSLALDVFKGMLGDYAYYLYATFQPSLLDQSYLQDVSRLVRGYSDVLVDERFLQLNQWVPLPALLLLVVASLLVVQKRKV